MLDPWSLVLFAYQVIRCMLFYIEILFFFYGDFVISLYNIIDTIGKLIALEMYRILVWLCARRIKEIQILVRELRNIGLLYKSF